LFINKSWGILSTSAGLWKNIIQIINILVREDLGYYERKRDKTQIENKCCKSVYQVTKLGVLWL
jgi:uncharacterized membrane protein